MLINIARIGSSAARSWARPDRLTHELQLGDIGGMIETRGRNGLAPRENLIGRIPCFLGFICHTLH